VDTFDNVSDIHRRLAVRYLRDNPWVGEDGALSATQFEADRDQEESDRKDEALRAMMARLYPEFQRHHDEYAAAIAEGRTPVVPGRRGEAARHPSPNPPAPEEHGPPGPGFDAPIPAPPAADLEPTEGPDGRPRPRAVVEAARRYAREGGISYAAGVEKVYRIGNEAEARGEVTEEHSGRALDYLRRESCGWQEALYRTGDPLGGR
jgi:hypothetical protein